MIERIARKTFFNTHPVAAAYTATSQRWAYRHMAESEPRLAHSLKRRHWYDCLDHPAADTLTELCVVAYAAENKGDYFGQLPQRLLHFFEHLGAPAFWFFDEYPADWQEFAFASFQVRNRFRKLTGRQAFTGCFQTDAAGFMELLPLFLYARRFNEPVVFLYAGGPVPVVLFLCDDGNLHTSYAPGDKAAITAAAAAAGLLTGEAQILCSQYHIHQLPAR